METACLKDYTRKLLDKARDAIEMAEAVLEMNKADLAAGRAMYGDAFQRRTLRNINRGENFDSYPY